LIGLLAALLGFGAGQSRLLEEIEWKSFDLRMRWLSTQEESPAEIVMVLIDEASLRLLNPLVGRWPWPRAVHAELLDFLSQAGAQAVAFDILFTENERPDLQTQEDLAEGDRQLVAAVAAGGLVSSALQLVHDSADEYNQTLTDQPLPAAFVQRFALPGLSGSSLADPYNNAYPPFAQLWQASKRIGFVEFSPDRDGIYRHARLIGAYAGHSYPALSLSLLLDRYRPEIDPRGQLLLSSLDSQAPSLVVPLQRDGSYLVKPYRNFKTYSVGGILATMQKIMQGDTDDLPVDPAEFHDKIVFIGASAVGVEDLKPLPFGSLAPGVYLHGSILGNILQRDFLIQLSQLSQNLLLLLGALLIAWLILVPQLIWVRMLSAPFLILALLVGGGLLFRNNLVLDMVPPLTAMGTAWLASFARLSSTEGREKRKVRRMLGQYVSPVVLQTIIENSRSDVLQAEVGLRENLTILFADIRGFTSLSEVLPAEQVVGILNGYFKGMVEIIFRRQGTLDKFIGDAIMAFWGAPLRDADHPQKGVEAALEMLRWLELYNQNLAAQGQSPLDIGIGMHSGEVILGNIGSEQKLDYTIIGDNVNLCSRLEGLSKQYGASLIISESTWQQLSSQVIGRKLDLVQVKGKTQPIAIYQVFGLTDEPAENTARWAELARRSEAAFALYLARQWQAAMTQLKAIARDFPEDRPTSLLLERISGYQQCEPDPTWTGVWTLQTK
jgi:adenylate cyclase